MSQDPDSFDVSKIYQFLIEESMDIDADFEKMKLLKEQQEGESSNGRTKKRRFINRDRQAMHTKLYNDYFHEAPMYKEEMFRRRYRMRKELFERIVEGVSNHSEYFRLRTDATGKVGLSPLQKCTAAIRLLAYGGAADRLDETLRVPESTGIECLFKFCKCVIRVFGKEYLRKPNANDIQRLLELHSDGHGFPGMLGSIDCMHWKWKNCPVAWKGQFTRGDHGVATIMLEAVASQDLWIWHAFFGVAGSNNDITVLNQSSLFTDVLEGTSQPIQFTINGTQYTKGYYLADGIYPEWATLVKSFTHPDDPKRKKFKEMQEAARKDVERAFGVLQSRWAIVREESRFWHKEKLGDIMYACIILHNMIVEDEKDAVTAWFDDESPPPVPFDRGSIHQFQEFIQRSAELCDREAHQQLRADLVEHIWERFGNNGSFN